MDLRQLRYFLAVVDAAHFGRAAEQLGVAQSAVSRQVQQLERTLGVQLLERYPRLRLTPAGLALAEEGRVLLIRAEAAMQRTVRAATPVGARLNVGYVEQVAVEGLLGALARAFHHEHPRVVLDLRVWRSAEAEGALRSGQLDVALSYLDSAAPDLLSFPLTETAFALVVPCDHRLATGRSSARVGEVAGEPFISVPRDYNPAFHTAFLGALRDAGLDPHVTAETHHVATAMGLVAMGAGVTVAPVTYRATAPAEVCFVPLDDFPMRMRVFCQLRKSPTAGSAEAFVGMARAMCEARRSPVQAVPTD
jgi:DNA-binding transcriptional LysR family regulator